MEDFRRWLMLSERNYVDGKPFATSLEALRYIYDNHPSPKNLVVTYTEVDKVGVNPQTQYTTPLGIYFYTAKYVLNKKGKVPLGAERPYMFVCELTRPGKVMHMRRDDDGGEASRLWRSTEDEAWGDENNRGHSMHAGLGAGAMAKVVAWSKALRDAGVSGFIDHGTGTIWPAEPFQGVVFTAGDLRVLHRLENSLRHFQDMPGYDRRGVYAVGTTGRGAWQKFLKDVHMAGTDANRSRVVAKATEDAWVLFQGAPERDRMRMARIVVRYAELDGEIVQAMMTATDDKVGMAGIIGQANLGMMDGAGVALQLRTAKDVGALAGVFGRELLNKMDDAQFTSAMGNIRHTFGELYHGGGRSAESFAQAMVSNGRRLSDANVLSLLQVCQDRAEMERVSQLVGKARAEKVLGGGRRGAQVSEGLGDYLRSREKPFDPGRRRFMRTAASEIGRAHV